MSPALAGGFLNTVPRGKSPKFLILMKANLSIFVVVACVLGVISKNPLLNARSQNAHLCFFL